MLGKNSINLWKVEIVSINDAYFLKKKPLTVLGLLRERNKILQ